MQKFLLLLTLVGLSTVSSCGKNEETPSNEVRFNVALTGSQEVPATASANTGNFTGTYNKTTKILSYTLSYAGFTPNAWHIHKAAKGVNGAILKNFGTTFTSPFTGPTFQFTAAEERALLADSMYVNYHSTSFPGGEIRAQLIKQ